jgi:hypothetical protein
VVRGTLVEQRTTSPIPGAGVRLFDDANVAVDSARTSADGRFTLRARRAGTHYLYFDHPGYASITSPRLELTAGDTLDHRFTVPLVSGAAIRRMSEVIDIEQRLQTNLTELCGERPRPHEAGILVGVVRRDPDGEPLAGAVVRVKAAREASASADTFERATVTSANGVYILCNVPPGTLHTRTELLGYRMDEGPAELRAGEIAWYDVYLRAR